MKKGIINYALLTDSNDRYHRLKELGFDYVDYCMNNTDKELYTVTEEEAKALILKEKKLMDDAGIKVSQAHGPLRYPPRDAIPADRAERLDKMRRSIRLTKLLDCKYWVVHPIMPFGLEDAGKEEETYKLNIEFMRELLKTAKENDITICLENLPFDTFSLSRPEAIIKIIKEIDDNNFKMCMDTGHVAVFSDLTPGNVMRKYGEYIKVLHVHDNDGKVDWHWLLDFGIVDWKDFYNALKEVNFDGVFSYETAPVEKKPQVIREELIRIMSMQIDALENI